MKCLGLRLVFRAFFSVLAFFGLIANFVVFLVTSQNERKQKPSSIYLLLLSVADIVFLSCMMFTSYFDNSFNYPFSNGFCKFQAVLDTASQVSLVWVVNDWPENSPFNVSEFIIKNFFNKNLNASNSTFFTQESQTLALPYHGCYVLCVVCCVSSHADILIPRLSRKQHS